MFKKLRNTYNLWRQSQSAIIDNIPKLNNNLQNISDNLQSISEIAVRNERARQKEAAYLASISDSLVKMQKNMDDADNRRRRYTISNLSELKTLIDIYTVVTNEKVIPGWYGSDNEFLSDFSVNAESLYNNFGEPIPLDVFSADYRDFILRFFKFIHGRDYSESNEGFSDTDLHTQAGSTDTGFNHNIYEIRTEYKALIEEINDIKPARTLEMGFGTGKICSQMTGSGYVYYGLDKSLIFTKMVQADVKDISARERIKCGSFFDIDKFGESFDLIIFDKSFHHILEQEKLLNLIYDNTTENARIILHREAFEDVTPEFGLNIYSAESLLQIHMRGWLELIFSMRYLQELCSRTKWKIVKDYEIDMGKMVVLAK